MNTQQLTEQVTVNELDKSRVEITIELGEGWVAQFRTKALDYFNNRLEVSGFRKGRIPERTIIEHIGESALLEEAASIAVRDALSRIFTTHRIDAIGRPEVTVTKLASESPLCFVVKTAIVPTFTLPDYRTIAQTVRQHQGTVEVAESEVEQALIQIRKAIASNSDILKDEGELESEPPELTLEAVRAIGNFPSVEDFTTRLRAQLIHEKEARAKEKARAEIAEDLVQATPIELPDILIEGELQKMQARLNDELAQSSTTFVDYLSANNKTEDELKALWRPDAEKKALLQLILNAIAEREHIAPDTTIIEEHADRLMRQLKNADRQAVRTYVQTILVNGAVFQFLENL
jgi:FKBP-type peptidyl-prolyl cis-trans isomerase (trigger factor)